MFQPGPYPSIQTIKNANRAKGQHFFEDGTLQFFDSQIEDAVYGGRYFITSEQFHGSNGYHAPRMWTIRRVEDNGAINTVGAFNKIETLDHAIYLVEKLIARQNEGLTEDLAVLLIGL